MLWVHYTAGGASDQRSLHDVATSWFMTFTHFRDSQHDPAEQVVVA